MDAFAQWKFHIKSIWEINAGINASYLLLNNTWGIDPRLGIKYFFRARQSVSLAVGLYSKPDHLSTYFIERRQLNGDLKYPNLNLPMLRAFHLVAGYEVKFKDDLRLKIEGYFQSLFKIPVSANRRSVFSTLNASTVFEVIFQNDEDGAQLVSEGTGKNYGIECTLEKFFSRGYYYLLTTSLFDSKFRTLDGQAFHTRYATNYATNLVGGKEWSIGVRKKNAFGLNVRLTLVGGLRTTPILIDESRQAGMTVYDNKRFNTICNTDYHRLDLGISYRINSEKKTHWIRLDIQNLTDHRNVAYRYFDQCTQNTVTQYQNGLIPFVNYRIEF
ncbi:MAG: TonB-dependent receptor [Saprospiraceae bacterium]|nr:TonB-dependent receptor [Saprospiraceae bacterium]